MSLHVGQVKLAKYHWIMQPMWKKCPQCDWKDALLFVGQSLHSSLEPPCLCLHGAPWVRFAFTLPPLPYLIYLSSRQSFCPPRFACSLRPPLCLPLLGTSSSSESFVVLSDDSGGSES